MTEPLKTPVAFIIFNRPKCTKRVFERIREARPEKLYLIADAPRPHKKGEAEKCMETRQVVESMIDWSCEVHKNYAEENMGCRMRPATGISWVFDHELTAIILEDDCLPEPSFFRFCEQMLQKYTDRSDIMLVCGTNIKQYAPRDESSYFFSRFAQTWGWATWKSAWRKYDVDLIDWPQIKQSTAWQQCDLPPEAKSFYESKINEVYYDGLDAWDYGWSLTIALHGGRVIIPAKNLVKNIGFGLHATHTLNPLNNFTLSPSHPMPPPYSHPKSAIFDDEHDHAYTTAQYSKRKVWLREYLFRQFMRLKTRKINPDQ